MDLLVPTVNNSNNDISRADLAGEFVVDDLDENNPDFAEQVADREAVRAKTEHVDYKRMSHKPLLFGLEQVLAYAGHGHTPLIGMIQNHDLG